jgi:hypothetical protein
MSFAYFFAREILIGLNQFVNASSRYALPVNADRLRLLD